MIKIASILFICIYLFGVTRIGLVYSTHEFFHHIAEEHQASENECEDHCTIIKAAESSETNTETKFFKLSLENISSHIAYNFNITQPLHKEIIFSKEIFYPQKELLESITPPPKS